ATVELHTPLGGGSPPLLGSSVEDPANLRAAARHGYASALVVEQFPSVTAFKLRGRLCPVSSRPEASRARSATSAGGATNFWRRGPPLGSGSTVLGLGGRKRPRNGDRHESPAVHPD